MAVAYTNVTIDPIRVVGQKGEYVWTQVHACALAEYGINPQPIHDKMLLFLVEEARMIEKSDIVVVDN